MPNESKFPAPGMVLWAVDVELEHDVFRSGAAKKPNVDYLRFLDIGIDEIEGRISEEHLDKYVVKPGQGISLFLERMIPKGLVVMDAAEWNKVNKKKRKKIHWWGIDQGHPIPSGLSLVYDGQPPGHCTLTVTRTMPVKTFLNLVALVSFSHRNIDLVAPIKC
jgi:hypothetical protein